MYELKKIGLGDGVLRDRGGLKIRDSYFKVFYHCRDFTENDGWTNQEMENPIQKAIAANLVALGILEVRGVMGNRRKAKREWRFKRPEEGETFPLDHESKILKFVKKLNTL